MKEYFRMSSTFIIVAAMLFCTNRLYEAITSINLTMPYYLSIFEKCIYIVSFVFLLIGFAFLGFAFKNDK